jgi:hypothetical protein
MSSKGRQQTRDTLARIRAEQSRRRRRRLWLAGIGGVIVAAVAAVAVVLAVGGGGGPQSLASGSPRLDLAPLATLGKVTPPPSAGPLGPEGVPIPAAAPLASTASSAQGQQIEGIGCLGSEQTLFHIHAHLTIFVNGAPRQVPAGIGIPGAVAQNTAQGAFITSGSCFYWLHTHSADGIIHIESPVHREYTLGNFFAEWGQPLGPAQVGPAHGRVTAIYDGQVYRGNPADIPLNKHAQIQLEVGTPIVGPESIAWPAGL